MYRIKENANLDDTFSYTGEYRKHWWSVWEYIEGSFSYTYKECNTKICKHIKLPRYKYHEVNCEEL